MTANSIRNALGLLQDDPDHEQAYVDLKEALSGGQPEGMSPEDARALLASARRAHEARREHDAVASLLELEVLLAQGNGTELALLKELARVTDEDLFDDARAEQAYGRVLALQPGDETIEEALESKRAKRSKWGDLVERYAEEAEHAHEARLKASLLVSAAETAYRYGRPAMAGEKGAKKKLAALQSDTISRLDEALATDPKNRRAGALLERIYREGGKWEPLAALLEKVSTESTVKEDKTAGFLRLARVLSKKIKSPERAVAAYERVLDLSPGNSEATSFLVDFFTERQMWDHLVSLYDEQLATSSRHGQADPGIVLQIAMVNWKMRNKPEAAEPYFERLRKTEPAHPGMLAFFRETLTARNDHARLSQILTDAQRALPDGLARTQLAAEVAKLAEEGANASKAIEQWRNLLRQDAGNKQARDALKRLYRQTGAYAPLAEILRGELERVPAGETETRLALLREMALLYREHVKSDSSLLAALTQITQLVPDDVDAVRELVRVYDALGRVRDLLAAQTRLAELEAEPRAKAELLRQVARRWLEQFSNAQNATEAYEKVLEAEPGDTEALAKLKELYAKRRAFKPLYDLLEREAASLEGAARRETWIEMAKLAADRLDRGPDALKLYQRVLDEDPTALAALDALEKQAERDKDFKTVADALERRVAAVSDEATKLGVLQKLGAVYAERLHDHAAAMKTWRRVLELSPGHAKALRVLRDTYLGAGDYEGLTALFAQSKDWEGLAEVLSSAAERAGDATSKVELSYRAADVYETQLDQPERASRSYERVLAVRPDEERAARALIPLYETDEKWARLPTLYEVLLSHADSDDAKLAILEKLVEVTGKNLQDRAAAYRYAQRAFEIEPTRKGAVAALEAEAQAAQQWQPFVEALEARLAKSDDAREKRTLKATVAETYATHLGRVDEAVAAYRSLVEAEEGDEDAVTSLDRILRAQDRREDLRWLYELRVSRAGTSQKVELLGEWAALEEEALGAPDRAAELHRRVLEIVPKHGRSLRALARLLQHTGSADEAVQMLERDRDQREGSERAAREIEIARLQLSLKRPTDALAAVKRALDLTPDDAQAIAVVEELLGVGETRSRAAALLEEHYAQTNDRVKQAQVIEVLIATAPAKGDRIALYEKLIGVHEALGSNEAAFEVAKRAAEEFPSELSLWDRLGVLANRTGGTQAFVDALARAVPATGESNLPAIVDMDLSERIATLYDEMLGEVARATPYLERVLARDATNERAFGRLKQILTSLEQWGELEALYERTIAAAQDRVRQTELLAEAALVAEEITAEAAKATAYYERILEIDATHEQATRALESLYATQQSFGKLAALLTRRLAGAVGDDALTLRLRLGTLCATRLGDFAQALEHIEVVLQNDPRSREARDLAEQCLTKPELRARAAVALESVYTAIDEPRDLVRVLDVRLETLGPDHDEARVELLRRIAELRDDRLHEDIAAFDAYGKLVPLAPDDEQARTRLLDIARRISAHEQAAGVLLSAARAARAPQPKGEILMSVAKVYEDLLDQPTQAEAVYREVLDLDRTDAELSLPAAKALERIYAGSQRPKELAESLRVQVELEDQVDVRRELWGRLGELYETALSDPTSAVAAWRARIEDDPADEQALASLDRLYTQTAQWRLLVDVLRARERATSDGAARKELMTRLAETLAQHADDANEAILAYRAILDDFGAEHTALAALAPLYESAGRFEDLAETLEGDLALADATDAKLALLARLGRVRQDKLNDLSGAIEAYRQALTLLPAHAPSRAALEGMLDLEAARRDAAQLLRPLYEADGEHKKLLRVLDIEAEVSDSPGDRLHVVSQAMMVAEQNLADLDTAFGYASRGLRESVTEPDLPQWIERAERLATAANNMPAFVALLRDVVANILDEQQQLDVLIKVAELSRDKLGDDGAAREHFEKALQIRADDHRVLEALERLYEASKNTAQLLDIVRRRVDVAENDAQRKELLYKQARLCEESGDAASAVQTFEHILDLALERDAISALERLYAAGERWDDLVALYERQIGAGPSDEQRAALHHALGDVASKHQNDFERAFGEYEAALKVDPQHAATIASLEALMQVPAHAARSAEMLEGVYLAKLDWRRVMATLDARLAVSQDPDERRQLLRRLAKLHEEQEENYGAALETAAKLLAEDITDETTWNELERLARVASAEGRLADIFAGELAKVTADEPATAQLARRTGELYEKHKEPDKALEFYRRAYTFAPDEAGGGVFEAIDRLLSEANKPTERVALYRDALEYRDDPGLRLTTLHTIALIEEAELADDDAAIHTYQQALDLDETDTHSLESLCRLYARRGRSKELADLLRRRAEQAALPDDEARFRFELGQLLGKLGDTTAAIDEYHNVVELLPPGSGHAAATGAVTALEALLDEPEHKARVVDILRPIYERADDWRHLVRVNAERLGLANDASEKVAILRETAQLWEQRGGDRNRAFDAVRSAFVLDPDDGITREELDRLADATKRYDDLADAYEKGIEQASDLAQRELLGALAKLHDERRDDPRRALDAYSRLVKLDEADIAPLERMNELATLLSDWTTLVRVLARMAELQHDDTERAETWRRVGETRRDMLDDAGGAVEAYERALELEPASAPTVDSLIALYESKDDAARLVELYRKRIELAGDDETDLKFDLLVAAADRSEKGLEDRREAIALLGEALAVRPGEPAVMGRLDRLYSAESMWPELLENLRLQAAESQDEGVRRALKKRMGALLATELEDPQKALDAYREVLEAGFDDDVIAAVRAIGEGREELRAEAADVLEPVLRTAGKQDALADVLEMRLRAQTEPSDRAQTLRAIARVVETGLSDPSRAQDALHRALAEEPSDSLHDEIQRVAGVVGDTGWQRYAATLSERAGSVFDAAVTTDLLTRLGKIAEERLHDDARAAKAYAQAAESAGDSPEILAALDRLYSRLGDSRNLADVLERRAAVEADAAAQAELSFRIACLQLKEFGEKKKALATLRVALERSPEHGASREVLEGMLADDDLWDEAFEALEWVYRALGRSEDLAKLYERRVGRAEGSRDRNRSRLDLARVLDEQAHDAARAQRVVEEAIKEDASDPDALAELERLAGVTGQWKEAADALATSLRAGADVPAQARTELWMRVAGWHKDKTLDAKGAEDAFTEARHLDPENTDVLGEIEALQRTAGRERDLTTTLRARARLEGDLDAKRTLLREAKSIAEGTLADPALTEAVLRDLLAEDEGDLWALEELGRLREQAGEWGEVVDLLLRRAELEADGKAIADLRHRAAKVAREHLKDDARAVSLYEELFEADAQDQEASSALRGLYASLGKRRELGKLLQTLIDTADAETTRSQLRIELAKLQDAMGDAPAAIDTLRSVLEENRGHADAVVALSELLEKSGKDDELAELLHAQIELTSARGDTAAELVLQVRLGEVYETRLRDAGKALQTFEAVLERDPSHHGALEAVARLAEGRASWEVAARALEKLVAVETETERGVALAQRLASAREKLGQDDGVESALGAALRFDPKNTAVRDRLRALYEKNKKWSELAAFLAEDATLLESSGQPAPAVVKLLRRAADIHLAQRNVPADAVPLLERAAALVPQDRDLLLALCDAYAAAERGQNAAEVLERIIASFGGKRTKELAVYHHRLGRALAGLGNQSGALAQYDLAFKVDPGSPAVLRDLSMLSMETGDFDRAQKTFRALLLQKLDPTIGITKGEVFFYLGEISMKQGDKVKAVQMLERALENDPDLAKAKARLAEWKAS